MATIISSIDRAAGGYVPHRFVRSLAASVIVMFVFNPLTGTVIVWSNILRYGSAMYGGEETLASLLVQTPLILAAALLAPLVAATLANIVTDLLPQRIVALILIVCGALAARFTVVTLLAWTVFWWVPDSNYHGVDKVFLVALGWLGTLCVFEVLRFSWWQLTVPKDAFLAVMGWRPPALRIGDQFRRQIGLPSFLAFSKRDTFITALLYYAVAMLNVGLLMALLLPIIMTDRANPGLSAIVFCY